MSEPKHQTTDDLPLPGKDEYLGDGLYASFDGFQVFLRAPHENGDHFVALEPQVFHSLMRWIRRYPLLAQHFGLQERP